MTTHRSFKQRVRARMAKTGESYTAARRILIAQGDHPEPITSTWQPPVSEESITRGTGHGWSHWLGLLDAWGGTKHTHTEIAAWLAAEHDVPSWWRQAVTVGYERARGRALGQQASGFTIGVSKTFSVGVEDLFAAFRSMVEAGTWLPAAELRVRKVNEPKSIRYDWDDGSTRVIATFDASSSGKSRLTINHERLPDAETAAEMKTWWRSRLAAFPAAEAPAAAGQLRAS
jgi:hypothetical protein